MLILNESKLIFLRCRKTASTSLEIELSKYARPGDIITPVCDRDESLRMKHKGQPPQCTMSEAGEAVYFNHITAQEVQRLEPKKWTEYYKFCVDRNPWDKVVSMYRHRTKRHKEDYCFNDFITSGEFRDALNFGIYTIDGEIAVDKVIKYEALNDELRQLFTRHRIPFDKLDIFAKSHFRKAGDDYRSYYSPRNRELVAEYFNKEIEMHGYVF